MKWAVSLLQCAVLCSLQTQSSGADGPCLCPFCDFSNVRNASHHLFNVMFNKPGKMSSLHEFALSSCTAVNGITNTTYAYKDSPKPNCVHTGYHDRPYENWVEYDLQTDYTIDRITVVKRFNEILNWHVLSRVRNLEFSLNGDVCFRYPGFGAEAGFMADPIHYLKCYQPVTGQYLRITKQNQVIDMKGYIYYIQICEIIIWVCEQGYYGKPYETCRLCPSKCTYRVCNNYYGCDLEVNRNLASHKTATQSSILQGAPNKAVDNREVGDREVECTSTDPVQDGPKNRWWRVDLGILSRISYVEITNRMDCCGEKLKNFKVLVSTKAIDISRTFPEDHICTTFTGTPQFGTGTSRNFTCSKPLVGRHIAVVVPSPDILHFCEFQAYGYTLEEIPPGGTCSLQSLIAWCVPKATCISGICKISIGESCTAQDGVHCVSGTTCSDKICALNLNQPCKDNPTHCRSDLTCDEGFKCKLKMHAACSTTSDDCASGTACDRLKECRLPIDATCQPEKPKCPYGAVCDRTLGLKCKWDVGQDCESGSFCMSGTICDSFKKCKRPIGHACRFSSHCPAGSTCKNSKCACSDSAGDAASSCDAKEGRASGSCTAERKTVCIQHSTCIAEKCTCDSNYGVFTEDYSCRLSVPGVACTASTDCNTGLTCEGGKCKFEIGNLCKATTECSGENLCSEGVCKIPVGKTCENFPNLCDKGTNCQNGICKLELRQPCDLTNDQCDPSITVCSKTANETSETCKLKPGGGCEGIDKTLCGSNSVCDTDNVCKIEFGVTCTNENQNLCMSGTVCSNEKCLRPLGKECKEDDDCMADAVCDNFRGNCKLKAGASCKEPKLKDSCSSGSSCNDQDTCGCAEGTTLTGNKCEPTKKKVSGGCVAEDGTQACDDENAVCVMDATTKGYKCECKPGFEILLTNYTCGVALGSYCGNATVVCTHGSTCSFDGLCVLELGENCKGDKGNWCQPGSVCDDGVCKANLRGDCSGLNSENCKVGTVCDILSNCKFPINSTCGTTDACVAGAKCIDSTCQCASGVTVAKGSLCEPAEGTVTGSCGSTACSDPNAVCTDENICECKEGYTAQDEDLSCKIAVNNPCTDESSPCSSETSCDTNSKQCKLKLGEGCDKEQEQCGTGSICDVDQKCKLDFGGTCKGQEMHCKSGVFCDFDGKCKYGTSRSCETEAECTAGAECFNGTCQCVAADSISAGSSCLPRAGFAGGYCDDVTPCKDGNATCVSDKCECVKGGRSKVGFRCNAPAKGAPESATEGFLWVVPLVAGILALSAFLMFLLFRRKKEGTERVQEEMKSRMADSEKLTLELEQLSQAKIDIEQESSVEEASEHEEESVAE